MLKILGSFWEGSVTPLVKEGSPIGPSVINYFLSELTYFTSLSFCEKNFSMEAQNDSKHWNRQNGKNNYQRLLQNQKVFL